MHRLKRTSWIMAVAWIGSIGSIAWLGCGDVVPNNADAGDDPPDSGGPIDAPPDADNSNGPVLNAITPDSGNVFGDLPITLTGSGFDQPGGITVSIGGVEALGCTVVDDSTVTCLSPRGAPGPAPVAVSNNAGQSELPDAFFYTILYGADGKAGVAGNLYSINPATGEGEVIGPIGFAITGMAMSPDGEIFATQSTQLGALGASNLIRIDRNTGAGEIVAPLLDEAGVNHVAIADVTFFQDRLLGWTENGDMPVELDPLSARVTIIGGNLNSRGSGLATRADGLIFLAPQDNVGGLFTVDPLTGVTTVGPTLTGGVNTTINSLAFLDGQLFAADNAQLRDPLSPLNLAIIDPATGVMTQIGPLPPGIDAMVSNRL
jgi:hypothetical protein